MLEIVKEGLLAAEPGGAPPIGALWAVENGSKTEIGTGSLLAPGGVAVADEKRIYVTTGTVFGPGAGEVVRFNDALGDGDDDDRPRGDDRHDGDDDDHGDRRHREGKKHRGGKQRKKGHNGKRHGRRDD